jgi:flagellar biosynthesis protein FlhA
VAEHFAQKFSTEEKKMGTIHNSVDESIYNLLKVSELEVVIGDAIITEDIKNRVKNIRRNIAEETGFIFQDVLIKNDQSMGIEYYQILYKGIEITSGKINPEKFLVVSIADLGNLFGINGFYPDEGSWVKDSENDIEGITTVDPTSLIALHLYETIKKISHELMTKESVQLLINNLEILHPITVKDCLEVAPISLVQKVLRKLLHDNIPIKDMVTILETITDYAGSKNIDVIVEAVRKALSRVITNMYKKDNKLDIITLSQEAEQHLLQSTTNQNGTNVLSINVPQINKLVQMSMAVINELSKRGDRAVLIVDPMIRKSIADIYNSFDLDIVVLSHSEVETTVQFDRKAIIDTEF